MDWSYTFQSFDRLLCSGLNRLWKERAEAIEDLILGFHIYDSLDVLAFVDTPGNKTDELVEFLSLRLQQLFRGQDLLLPIVKTEPRRLSTHEVIHDGIRRFGYFSFFIQLWFALYRRSSYVDLLDITLGAAEAYRAKLHPIALRIRFWARLHRMFELAILDVKHSEIELAATYLEQITGRGFLDLQAGIRSPKAAPDEMEWGDYDVASLFGAEVPEKPELYPIEKLYKPSRLEDFPFYSRERLLQFVDECSLLNQERWDLPSRQPMAVAELVKNLPMGSAYLSYRQIDNWLHCVVLKQGEKPSIFWCFTGEEGVSDIPLLEWEFARVLRLLRKLSEAGLPVWQLQLSPIDGPENLAPLVPILRQLHDLVLRGPRSAGDCQLHETIDSAKHLLIAPGFPLQGIPFSALHDGVSFLIERHVVAYVPNATWCALKRWSSVRVRTALVVADPTTDLPGARLEGRTVAELLGRAGIDVTYLQGNDATSERLLEGTRAFDIIHFAGHGNFELEKASFLSLADGALFLDETLNAEWRPAFFFANACRTAQRQVHLLEETLSFAASLLACGTGATVGSLWQIDDEVAVSFARTFYSAVLKAKTVGEAYQASMKQLIHADVPIKQWAPLILAGDPQLRIEPQ